MSPALFPDMNSNFFSLSSMLISGHTDRLTTITDNLANSATPGYRRSYATQIVFDNILTEAINSAATQQSSSIITDFTQGPIRTTGRSLDFAVNGRAFFVVEKNGSEYYTRNGKFNVAPDGRLITTGNLNVQGEGGVITIPSGTSLSTLTVDSDGTIRVGEQTAGKIRMVEFKDTTCLRKVGPTLFYAPSNVAGEKTENSTISNRTLEGSNTSIFEEMAELISCMRSYEACHKMLKSQDQTEAKMIRELS